MAEEPAGDAEESPPAGDDAAADAGGEGEGEGAEAEAEAVPPPPPPPPVDPNLALWTARDAMPLERSKEAKELREDLWGRYGASAVESLTVAELTDGLEETFRCRRHEDGGEDAAEASGDAPPRVDFDLASLAQRAHEFAREVRPEGLAEQLMFPEFRLVLHHLKESLDLRQVLVAKRSSPASPVPDLPALPSIPPLPEGVEDEEELEPEAAEERAAAIKALARAERLYREIAAKALRLACPLPETLDREAFDEAAARLRERGVDCDAAALWEECAPPPANDASADEAVEEVSEEVAQTVELADLINLLALRALRGKDFSELPDDAVLASEEAAAFARAHLQFLESAHAVRRSQHDVRVPPTRDALIECLQASALDETLLEVLVAQKRVDKNFRDPEFGWTPLMYAANAGNVEACALLLRAKAEIGMQCNNQNTALHLAARANHLDTVNFLISNKCPLNSRNGNGWTALTWASARGLSNIVEALLQAQAKVCVPDTDGRTEAMWAARHGHTKVAKSLLDKGGFDLSLRDREGMSLADHARNYVEIHRALLDAEAANQGLLTAVQRNDATSVARCIKDGANVNAKDDNGWTALTWSMMHKSVDLVRLLAQYNADPEVLVATSDVLSDLSLGGPELRQELEATLNKGLDSKGRLLTAARDGHWQVVEHELDDGALVNSQEDETLLTCLMFAAIQCNTDAVVKLAERGAKLDQQDLTGMSAAHFAVQAGDVVTVSMLHSLRADLALGTREGRTGQHLAARGDDAAMAQVLAAAGVSVNDEDHFEEQPVQVAARCGSASALAALLACGARPGIIGRSGRTVLHLAAAHGQGGAVRALLDPLTAPGEVCDAALLAEEAPATELLRAAAAARAALLARWGDSAAELEELGDTASGSVATDERRLSSSSTSSKKAAAKGRGRGACKEPEPGAPASWGGDLLDAPDDDGRTPLATAIVAGHHGVVQVLLEYGANVDAADPAGNTLLMLAVAHGSKHMVEDLVAAGAKRDARNDAGACALDLAFSRDVRQLLQARDLQDRVEKALAARGNSEVGEVRRGQMMVFRVRLEGLPPTVLEEHANLVVQDLLLRVLRGKVMPHRVTIATDPITLRPLWYAYADFLVVDDARELERQRRQLRIGPRRIGVINEGARLVQDAN